VPVKPTHGMDAGIVAIVAARGRYVVPRARYRMRQRRACAHGCALLRLPRWRRGAPAEDAYRGGPGDGRDATRPSRRGRRRGSRPPQLRRARYAASPAHFRTRARDARRNRGAAGGRHRGRARAGERRWGAAPRLGDAANPDAHDHLHRRHPEQRLERDGHGERQAPPRRDAARRPPAGRAEHHHPRCAAVPLAHVYVPGAVPEKCSICGQ